jgi:hypothetical protein
MERRMINLQQAQLRRALRCEPVYLRDGRL